MSGNNSQLKIEPLMLSSSDAAKALGLSRSAFYEHLASGRIGPTGFYFNTKKLFPVRELQAWIAAGTPRRQQWLADTLRKPSVFLTDGSPRDTKSL